MKINEPQERAHAIVVGTVDDPTEPRWRHPLAFVSKAGAGTSGIRAKLSASESAADPLLVSYLRAVHTKLRRAGVPHVIRVEEVFQVAPDQIALTYPAVEGESLLDIMSRGPLPVAWSIDVLCLICESIAAAHAIGVPHNALSPASVVCQRADERPTIGLLDFGLAPLFAEHDDSEYPQAHPVAPELVIGGGTGITTDIYQIGCLAYWMLAGVPPFVADDLATLRRRHAIEEPVRLDALRHPVRSPIADVIERALAKEPDERFASVAELGETLARLRPQPASPRQKTEVLSAEELAAQAETSEPTVRPKCDPRRTDVQFILFRPDPDEAAPPPKHEVFAAREPTPPPRLADEPSVEGDPIPRPRVRPANATPRRGKVRCRPRAPMLVLPVTGPQQVVPLRRPLRQRLRSWLAEYLGA